MRKNFDVETKIENLPSVRATSAALPLSVKTLPSSRIRRPTVAAPTSRWCCMDHRRERLLPRRIDEVGEPETLDALRELII